MFRKQVAKCLLWAISLCIAEAGIVPSPAENLAEDAPNHRHQVIVIGAGASGLAAASKLVELGVDDILVVEAMDRIGGRIHSLDLDDVDDTIEMGAQWIHGQEGNAVYEIASAMNITNEDEWVGRAISKYSFPNGTVLSARDVLVYMRMMWKATDGLWSLDSAEMNETVGSFYDVELAKLSEGRPSFFIENLNIFKDAWHRSTLIEDAADNWYEDSLKSNVQYVAWGGEDVTFKKGHNYREVLDHFLRYLQGRIMLNSTMSKIVSPEDKDFVQVQLDNGQTLEAEYVVVTVSLGILKERHSMLFEPSLPEKKINAIDTLNFGTVDKIYAWYEEPWWLPMNEGFLFLGSRPMNYTEQEAVEDWTDSIAYLYKVENRDNLLSFWIAGSGARFMETLSDEQVEIDISEFMEARFGKAYPSRTEPFKLLRSRWHSNPHVRGSYSHGTLESNRIGQAFEKMSEPVGRLHFAGEATNPHRYTTVDGAVETGWREAEAIASRIWSDSEEIAN